MKPFFRFTALFLTLAMVFSAVPQAFMEEVPGAEKPVLTASPLPGGILRGPGTGNWKIPTGTVPKGITPYPASAHPYANNMDSYFSYQEPDAIGYIVKFSNNTYMEAGYDFIYLFDENKSQLDFSIGGNVYYRFTGDQLSSTTLMINSPMFYTNLSTDATNTGYGFAYSSIIPVYPPSNTTTILYTCEQSGTNKVKLVWNKLNAADGYLVYRGTGGAAEQVADTDGVSLEDALPGSCEGKTYYYTIQPYYMDGPDTHLYTASNEKSVRIMTIPTFLKAFALNAQLAFISWKNVEEADGYYLYRSSTPAGTYSWVKAVTTNSTTNGTGGGAWYYKVKPYRTYSTVVTGTLSDASTEVSYVAPTFFTVEQSGMITTRIKWSEEDNVTGYQVYKSTAAGGPFTLLKTLKNPTAYSGKISTLDTNLTPGKSYYYKVRAYTVIGNETYYGSYTGELGVTILARSAITSAVRNSTGKTATIKWEAVSDADGYRLYRSESASGTYKYIKNIMGLQTKNYNLDKTKTYYYKIAAFRLYGTVKVTGSPSFYYKLK